MPTTFLYLLPVLFAAVWSLICYLNSLIAGWHSLSGRFRSQTEPCGETRTATSIIYSVYMRYWGRYSGHHSHNCHALTRSIFLYSFPFVPGIHRSAFRGTRLLLAKTNSFGKATSSLLLGKQSGFLCASPSAWRASWECWSAWPAKKLCHCGRKSFASTYPAKWLTLATP